jgi:hypothetical protein
VRWEARWATNSPGHAGTTGYAGTTGQTSAGNLNTGRKYIDELAKVAEVGDATVDIGRADHDGLLDAGGRELRNFLGVVAGHDDDGHPRLDRVLDGVVTRGGRAAGEKTDGRPCASACLVTRSSQETILLSEPSPACRELDPVQQGALGDAEVRAAYRTGAVGAVCSEHVSSAWLGGSRVEGAENQTSPGKSKKKKEATYVH